MFIFHLVTHGTYFYQYPNISRSGTYMYTHFLKRLKTLFKQTENEINKSRHLLRDCAKVKICQLKLKFGYIWESLWILNVRGIYGIYGIWCILWSFVIILWSFCDHFVIILWSFCDHFVIILWSFCDHLVYLFPFLVCCTRKNLATLMEAAIWNLHKAKRIEYLLRSRVHALLILIKFFWRENCFSELARSTAQTGLTLFRLRVSYEKRASPRPLPVWPEMFWEKWPKFPKNLPMFSPAYEKFKLKGINFQIRCKI
jgi:hypothetical protein